jgi:hypothetical protein
MTLAVDIAEAVTAQLNGQSFSQPFTTERLYLPVFELPEMKTLHVSVVPKGITVTQISRNCAANDISVDVAVQKKLEQGDNAEIDALLQLADELASFFRFKTLPGPLGACWIKTEHSALYSPEHVEQMRQFTSVFTLTFRVIQ